MADLLTNFSIDDLIDSFVDDLTILIAERPIDHSVKDLAHIFADNLTVRLLTHLTERLVDDTTKLSES
jgi:hypothetical protein